MRYRPLPHIIAELKEAPLPATGYHEFVFQWDRPFFVERVDMAGFKGGRRVLDAGCGFGNMSYALAQFNTEVVAVDRAANECAIARELLRVWGATNVTVEQHDIAQLPYAAESFDYIWCSGVMQFLDARSALAAFTRLLVPGGRVYVMTNSWGRWLYKAAAAHAAGNIAMRDRCVGVLLSQMQGAPTAVGNYLELSQVEGACAAAGLRLIASGPEGTIDLSGQDRQRPMFSQSHVMSQDGEDTLKLSGNIEFIAERA